MNEEQKAILRMLSEGKITAEEAEQLMEAIGKPTPPAEPKVRIPVKEATEEEPAPPRRGPDIQAKIESKVAAKMEKVREKMARKQEKMQRKMEEMHRKMERKGFRPPKLPSTEKMDGMLEEMFGKDGRMFGMDGMLKEMFGEEGMFGKKGDAGTQAVEPSEGAKVILAVGGGDAMVQGTDETVLRIQGEPHQCQVSKSDDQVKVSAGGTDVRVSVPKSVGSVRASVGGGDLSMEGLPVPLEVTVGGGDLSVRDVGSVKARIEGGDAHFAEITGDVEARTEGGSIVLKTVTGRASLQSEGGNVYLSGVEGDIEVNSEGGSVEGEDISGSLTLSTLGGEIILTQCTAAVQVSSEGVTLRGSELSGPLQFSAEGGDIQLENVTSTEIEASSEGGNIEVKMDKITGGSIRLTAEKGRVNLWLDPASAFDLTMEPVGQDLDVHTDLPLEIVERSERSLKARLNGGGAQIALSSGEQGFVGIWSNRKEQS
ncbi:MAG: DUF4097 family beta strand repeat protein [Candidatus Latescibacteria bacterium]|nr:DUF4097 family beta strand repeat protein [Candidatus Latescibacterota bacterium]